MNRNRLLTAICIALLPATVAAQGKIDLPVSRAELEHRAKIDSNDAAAHYNLALAYWNDRRWGDVEHQLHAAVALDPRLAVAHLALSQVPEARDPRLLDELGGASGARADSLRRILADADHEYRLAFLIDPLVDIRILAAAVSSSVSEADARQALGDAFADFYSGLINCFEGHYPDCESGLNRFLADETGGFGKPPTQVYWFLGLAAAHDAHYDAAISNFQILVDREQDAASKAEQKDVIRVPLRTNEYRYFIASFDHAAGNTEQALSLYQQVAQNDIGLFMAHVRMADIYEAARDYPRAIAERRNAINADPDDGTLQRDLGVTLGKSGDFSGAAAALQAAVTALPRDAESWFWLGLADEQLGSKAAARDAYHHVIALAPSRLAQRVAQARQHLAALQ